MPFWNAKGYRFDVGNLPAVGGVYGILNSARSVIYVGRTEDLSRRIGEHRNNRYHCMHRYDPVSIVFEVITTEKERIIRERTLIAEYGPPCNKTC
ncbi:excinuclease abc subunit c : : GIY-YIG [Gemmata massiliana]|uniref:Excinuclease abc subunit c:: GIY-YIG n=1 Tax=Gemmata massiliana TaxID=1210884 RepID=A0A6P2CZP1_9BACT|nr:GIY-YIG nuclease family protein [Gemmata massiliana]VTR93595.1 excinuclease abc subunit c : : GIY-YIG [Gemmata massiliana]